MEHHCDKPAATLSEDQQQEEAFSHVSEAQQELEPFDGSVQKQGFSVWKFNVITLKWIPLRQSADVKSRSACARSYHRWSLWDASEKEEVSDEEADAQVQVDGGAGSLDGAAELKRQDAECEAQQWDGQPDLGHHQEPKGVLVERAWYLNPFCQIRRFS